MNTRIYGTLDGITIIRIPNAGSLNANTMLCLYKGTSPFEAALVYCPYMPLVVKETRLYADDYYFDIAIGI